MIKSSFLPVIPTPTQESTYDPIAIDFKKTTSSQVPVTHAYNPGYMGGLQFEASQGK
jgi:hypothetical protein